MESNNFMLSSAFYSTGAVRNDFHHHNEYELWFVEEGSVEIRIGSKVYTAKKNDLILLANLEQHSLRQCSGVYHRYCIALHVAIADAYIQNAELLNLLKNHSAGFNHCMDMTPVRDTVIQLFQKLIACDGQKPYANELAACLMSELLIYVCQLHPHTQSVSLNETCKSRILAVQKYLGEHYREEIRISEICRQYYMSNYYLSHHFKELTGYSPKQYLTLVRLKHAAILIHDTTMPIQEIAAFCGFSDINNFCKQFKREYQCTPTAFRIAPPEHT